MSKYISKNVVFVSIFTATLSFIICINFIEIYYAVMFALMFALGMLLVLPIILYFDNKKYNDIDDTILEEILLKENVNFKVNDNQVRNGYVVLTENQIHFFSRDKKPFLEDHLVKEDIYSIQVVNHVNLSIIVNPQENIGFLLVSANTKKVIDKMIELRWIKLQ